MNIYAEILINEAKRRGIECEIIDESMNLFRLTYGGESIVCRESLSEKTSAVAITICDDKSLTHRILGKAGLRVPKQAFYESEEQAVKLLESWQSVVVKPSKGEQGQGITVDVRTRQDLLAAIQEAAKCSSCVLIEEYVTGKDLRMIVIDYKFVAAIERTPAFIVGDGASTIAELIDEQNNMLYHRSRGESQIPRQGDTDRVTNEQGYQYSDILPQGIKLQCCKTANFHTGGTIKDVTGQISSDLKEIAERASRVINIPVVGFDLIVPDYSGKDYVFIEANERPGLANHEPQPTAERFIDLLFPQTISIQQRAAL